jgi:enediyne biosynthesis protein E4
MKPPNRRPARLENLLVSNEARTSRRKFLYTLAAAACGVSLRAGPISAIANEREIFTDTTAAAGINWKQYNGFSPDRLLIEAMGGGVGFADLGGSGSLDIFMANGGETPRGKSPGVLKNALYRNVGNGKFEDIATEAGVDRVKNYGMGVAIADFDNDGHQDIFLTGFPRCTLYHNNGNGTFTDVTLDAGVQNAGRWAASAAWFDFDRDGYLDLVICNYVKFSFDGPQPKCMYGDIRTYCEQRGYSGMPLTLYRNNRDGTFTDVSKASRLDEFIGRALGVVAIDVDDDGWADLFIARDGSPNLLLINQRDGTFADAGLDAEVAYDIAGNTKAGMGVDAGDLNGDGRPDFVVTNFNQEYDSLFLGTPRFPFVDATRTSGLATHTQFYVGWGAHFLDYDNDGNLDAMIVNGHINEVIQGVQPSVKYKEPPLLLHNDGQGRFTNMSSSGGPAFARGYLARGLAIGDWDNDGAPDAIFSCLGESPVLLRNNLGQKNSWIGIHLEGTKSNRDGIGAKLTLKTGKQASVRWLTGGSSYLSTHDKRILFGLGNLRAENTVDIEIRWPSGNESVSRGLGINRYHQVKESEQ